MALLERLAILITADAAGAISEMKKLASEAEKNLGQAENAGSKFSGQMTKVGAAMMGAGAGLLAVGVSAANSTTDMGREVIKLQRYTGMTADEASKLRAVAQLSGVSVDSLAIALGRMSKAAEANSPAFDKLGVSARDSDGTLRSMSSLLPDIAERFKTMPAGAERTALAIQLFGRNGMEMMPFLVKGREGIAQLSAEAEKMGLVLNDDNIQAIRNNIVAQRELNATFDGLRTKIGLQMLPILTGFTETMKNIPGPVLDIIGPLTVFGGLGLTAAGGIGMIVGQLGNLKTFALSAVTGVKNLVSQVSAMPATFAQAAFAVAAFAIVFQAYQQRLSDAASAGRKALGDLSGLSVDTLKAKLEEVNAELDKVKEIDPNGANALEKLFRAFTNADTNQAALKAQKQTLEDAIAAASGAAGPALSLAQAQQQAADATDNHTSAVKALNDVLNASLDPFLNAISSSDRMGDSQRKLTDANLKAFYAQAAYNEAVGKYGPESAEAKKASDDLAQAQRDLDSAQGNAFKSALEFEQTLSILKSQMQDHPEIYKQNIDKINEMERSGKINAETAERMRAKLKEVAEAAGAIPTATGVKVTADTEEAKRKLQEIQGIIRDLLGLDNALTGEYGRGLGIRAPGKALGGRVGPGMALGGRPAYLVGELGPELFMPDTAGTIVTADRTRDLMGSGGNTVVNNFAVEINTVAGDPAAIERVVLDAIGRANVRGMTQLKP